MSDAPRQRAVLLTPVIPSDAGNGLAMRAGLLLTGLAHRFSVDVVAPALALPDSHARAFTDELAASCLMLEPALDAGAGMLALLATAPARERAAQLRPLPELCAGVSPTLAGQVLSLTGDAELVVVFRLYLAPLLDALLDQPQRPAILLDLDELDADSERMLGRAQQAERLERMERYYLPRVDHVTTAVAQDASLVRARNKLAAVTVIPNAVKVPAQLADPDYQFDLIFVGNLSYAPNVEAACWLCESVLPLLAHATLAIVGSSPARSVLELDRHPQVTVIADPQDVTAWYGAARIAVAPLLRGGGSKLKVIEALVHGRAVVSTSSAVRGQPRDGSGLVAGTRVADDPQAFAQACRELLNDPGRAAMLAQQGRAAVAQTRSIPVVAARIGDLAEETILRRGGKVARPLLTAALIVRDEQAMLGACLDSLVGVADEVVVVDTGSSDATVEIAHAHGARVLHHPWADDFAAPRNLGLDHAQGTWILYIDADERVTPLIRAELEQQLGAAPAMALRVLLRPTVSSTPYYEYRLWRNDPRIRFEGVMHEQVMRSVHQAAAQDGRPVDDWPGLLIEHVGYEGDQTRKHQRNLPLLRAQLSIDPANIYNWRHLARVLESLRQPEEATGALERATELALTQQPPSVDGGLAWADLVRTRHERGEDVTQLLTLGRARWPEHWLIRWMEGIIALESGRLSDAEDSLRSLLGVDLATLPAQGIAYDARMFGEWAYASLGLVLFRDGRYAEAAAAYAQAQSLAPAVMEYRIKRGLADARASQTPPRP